jgi:hypothetical protein
MTINGDERMYILTLADRGIIPWLVGPGAPKCELMEDTVARQVNCK